MRCVHSVFLTKRVQEQTLYKITTFGFWTLDKVLRNFFTYGMYVLCFPDPQDSNAYNQFITRGVNKILSVGESCFQLFAT